MTILPFTDAFNSRAVISGPLFAFSGRRETKALPRGGAPAFTRCFCLFLAIQASPGIMFKLIRYNPLCHFILISVPNQPRALTQKK
jgi:hypothetical protein